MRVIKVLRRIAPILFLASASLVTLAQPATSTPSRIDPAKLQLRWVFHGRNSTFTGASPTIVGNVIYVSTSSDVYAIDAISGGMIWHYVRQDTGNQSGSFSHIIRSILIHENHLFSLTEDAHFIALDTRSGNLYWDVTYSSSDSTCNNAHTAKGIYDSKKKIIWWQLISTASAHGESCFIALDGITGKLLDPLHSSSQANPTAAEQFPFADDPLVLTLRDSASFKTLFSFNLGQELESQTAGYFLDGRPLVVVTAGKDLFLFGQN
jgi:hypothetical protein